jgi:predicted transcriptional regulator
MDVDALIRDMDLYENLEDMVREGIDQGLIEAKGQKQGHQTYGLTAKGRKLVQVSNLRPFLDVPDA